MTFAFGFTLVFAGRLLFTGAFTFGLAFGLTFAFGFTLAFAGRLLLRWGVNVWIVANRRVHIRIDVGARRAIVVLLHASVSSSLRHFLAAHYRAAHFQVARFRAVGSRPLWLAAPSAPALRCCGAARIAIGGPARSKLAALHWL